MPKYGLHLIFWINNSCEVCGTGIFVPYRNRIRDSGTLNTVNVGLKFFCSRLISVFSNQRIKVLRRAIFAELTMSTVSVAIKWGGGVKHGSYVNF